MTETVALKYGRGELRLITPGAPRCAKLSVDKKKTFLTATEMGNALDNPVGSESFVKLFSSGDRVTIIVSDITRYTAAEIFLPPMLERLNSAGVAESAITILFSNGTHRKQTDTEKAGLVGDDIFKRVACVDHDPDGDLLPCGYSLNGSDVKLNRLVMECEKLVVTGSIGFHYLAGFGGGRKAVMPGVASRDDIKRFHYLSMNPEGPGRHSKADTGILDGNPLHEIATGVMKSVNPVFLLNTVIDCDGKAVDVVAGDPVASFDRGCEIARSLSQTEIETLADVVVASCGGFPKDINFIQAHKTYDNAFRAVKPGGKLFLAAKCEDGIGSDTFLPWFGHGASGEMEKALRGDAFQVNGQTALATAIKGEMCDAVLLSELEEGTVRSMGMRPRRNADDFLEEASQALDGAETGVVIPEGGYIFPVTTN